MTIELMISKELKLSQMKMSMLSKAMMSYYDLYLCIKFICYAISREEEVVNEKQRMYKVEHFEIKNEKSTIGNC